VIAFWMAFATEVIIIRRLIRDGWTHYRWDDRPLPQAVSQSLLAQTLGQVHEIVPEASVVASRNHDDKRFIMHFNGIRFRL